LGDTSVIPLAPSLVRARDKFRKGGMKFVSVLFTAEGGENAEKRVS
jgi:hypothetical protein